MVKKKPKIPCNKCTGCSACAQVCPVNCISMKYDTEGFFYPNVDEDACIHCYLCERTCPVHIAPKTIQVLKENSTAYALICQDDKMLQSSGSGGAFSLMAKLVLENGGVVMGAAWTKDWQVEHLAAYTWEQYLQIAGTKYVQSSIGSTFRLTRELLKSGKTVLFGGTGCQIAGLQSFLKKSYSGLITVNIACYGVPSPRVWEAYLEELRVYHKLGEIRDVVFRKKINNSSLIMSIEGTHDTYQTYVYGDPFGWGLVNDVINRPSCEHCLFKGAASNSDLTIGDARGLEEFDSSACVERGISIITANTEVGLQIVNKLKPYSRYFISLPLPAAISQNMGIIDAVNSHSQLRKAFFRNFYKGASTLSTLHKLKKGKWWVMVIRFAKRVINKLRRLFGV